MMILLQFYMVATFLEIIFKTLGIILTYDLMTLYDYKLRFYPKFIDAISYGPKSFQIHGIFL